MNLVEERYEDCDRCGERYHGEFISAYLRTEEQRNEVVKVCCSDQEVKDAGFLKSNYLVK